MMVRLVLAGWLALGLLSAAQAHFVFVVPDAKDSGKVVAVFSENLEVDEDVPADRLVGLKLTGRFEGGKTIPVECKPGKSCLTGELGLVHPQCVYGVHDLGVRQRGDDPAYVLTYYPKLVFAGAEPKHARLGDAAPVELVPLVSGAEVRFEFVAGGKPVAGADVTVIKPDGTKAKVKTDKNGQTEAFTAKGRYGAWAKHVVAKPGEREGKKYNEVRHYATLVVETGSK